MLLALISRRTLGSQPAYWARHFACALDVFQLLTADFQNWQMAMEGEAMGSRNNELLLTFVRQTLCELMSKDHWPGEQRECKMFYLSMHLRTFLNAKRLENEFLLHSQCWGVLPPTLKPPVSYGA